MAYESGVHLWLILMKTHEALRQHAVRQVQGRGIGFSDFAVLEVLLHKGPTPVNEIGRRVRLTSGSITAAIDRLERKALVERHGDPADRRTRVVHLTPAGRDLISTAFADHAEAMERATAGLTAEERAHTSALLKKLGRYAQAHLDS
jgi:MarR family transcriptional regulator, 2-MHQ and catechol-resistance regulon repressor